MKSHLVLATSLFSGTGLFAGNIVFDKFFETTIWDVLKKNNKQILDIDKEDESWLVLAQQYREYGTVKRVSDRNFKNQQNPEFLSEYYWETYAKGNAKFDKDEELAEILKIACHKSLDKAYTEELFDKVLKWCTLDFPQYVKNILKFQKENGDCRFWLIKSRDNLTGWFVWELLNDIRFHQTGNHLINLEKYLKTEEGREILEGCKKKKHGYLELSSRENLWQISPDWGNNTVHRLPLTNKQFIQGLEAKSRSKKQ